MPRYCESSRKQVRVICVVSDQVWGYAGRTTRRQASAELDESRRSERPPRVDRSLRELVTSALPIECVTQAKALLVTAQQRLR
jgi:hypothetical protein